MKRRAATFLVSLILVSFLGLFDPSSPRVLSGVAAAAAQPPQRGFILTSPKVLTTGTVEQLSLTTFGIPAASRTIQIRLLKDNDLKEEVLTQTDIPVQDGLTTWLELAVPKVPDSSAKLQVLAEFGPGDNYSISQTKEVRLRHSPLIVLIQTDKPIYKPGQEVKFRIAPLTVLLEPVSRYTEGKVWIENPDGIRVAQWEHVYFKEAIVQLELPLSSEPTLGTWSIHCEIEGDVQKQTFEVAEYVLPRFEVVIHAPDYVLARKTHVTQWEVCARYTYGKPVSGKMSFKLGNSCISQSYEYHAALVSGCVKFTVAYQDFSERWERRMSYCGSSSRSPLLEATAKVIEEGTGITQNSSTSVKLVRSLVVISFSEHDPPFFKPHLPYTGKVLVSSPEGSGMANKSVAICAQEYSDVTPGTSICKTFLSDSDGTITFTVPTDMPESFNVISLEARLEDRDQEGRERQATMADGTRDLRRLRRWYSAVGHYLQIEMQPTQPHLACNRMEYITVRYTSPDPGFHIRFYHQVMARGKLVQQGAHWRSFSPAAGDQLDRTYVYRRSSSNERADNIGEFKLALYIRSSMAPSFTLLVYFILPNGEIVADTRKFQVEECFNNEVEVSFAQSQQFPGTVTSFHVTAAAHSLCGISALDKSVSILSQKGRLTKEKIFSLLRSLELGAKSQPLQVRGLSCDNTKKQNVVIDTDLGHSYMRPPYRRPPPISHFTNRQKRSLLPFPPDIDGPLRPLRGIFPDNNYVDSLMAFEEAGMVVLTDFTTITRPCVSPSFPVFDMATYPLHGMAIPLVTLRGGISETLSVPTVTNEIDTEESSQLTPDVRSIFPETWLWDLITINESGKQEVIAKLPHTITEWTAQAVCIHRGQKGLGVSPTASITSFQPFFLSLLLPYSVVRGETVPVTVSIFNYLEDCLPIKLTLDQSPSFKMEEISPSENDGQGSHSKHKVCVCGGKSVTHRFYIRPLSLGTLNLTVHAFSFSDDDICDGLPSARLQAQDAVMRPLLVKAEGILKEEISSYVVCPTEHQDGFYEQNVNLEPPTNIVEGTAKATLFVTGDVMGPSLSNLDQLVKLPTGCGEQNLVKFFPNVLVLDFLAATYQFTTQADLRTRALHHLNVGYQRQLKFRHEDGSYGFFGLKGETGSMWLTAAVVKSFARAKRHIHIDPEDLSKSISWIVSKQYENGCFPSFNEPLDRSIKGGLDQSFLLVRDDDLSIPLTAYVLVALLESGHPPDSPVVERALRCMEGDNNGTAYQLALYAYAAALARPSQVSASRYLDRLLATAQRNKVGMYWDLEGNDSRALAVETAGYAVLTLLTVDPKSNLARVVPIVRWMMSQQNSQGGFVSTQDTVVALQALSTFAALVDAASETDLTLLASAPGVDEVFTLTPYNKLVRYSLPLPYLPSVLELRAHGLGCAYVQTSLQYHVPALSHDNSFFGLVVKPHLIRKSNCQNLALNICSLYKPFAGTSQMAVLDLKVLSGYSVSHDELQKLTEDENTLVKRVDIKDDHVYFYYEKLGNDIKCVNVTLFQDFKISSPKPAHVKIYDYYEPSHKTEETYDLEHVEPCAVAAASMRVDSVDPTLEAASTGSDEEVIVFGPEFSNVDHELDFPDGPEGNFPVYVPPPQDAEFRSSVSLDCPICLTNFPADFREIYCASQLVLRMVVTDPELKRSKVETDVSPHLLLPRYINDGYVNYHFRPSCDPCSALFQRGQYLYVISRRTQPFWLTSGLDLSESYVISTSTRIIVPMAVRTARDSCSKTA